MDINFKKIDALADEYCKECEKEIFAYLKGVDNEITLDTDESDEYPNWSDGQYRETILDLYIKSDKLFVATNVSLGIPFNTLPLRIIAHIMDCFKRTIEG